MANSHKNNYTILTELSHNNQMFPLFRDLAERERGGGVGLGPALRNDWPTVSQRDIHLLPCFFFSSLYQSTPYYEYSTIQTETTHTQKKERERERGRGNEESK